MAIKTSIMVAQKDQFQLPCRYGLESFVDIFGVLIEYYTLNQTDYIVGTVLRSSCRRSISNPKSYNTYAFAVTNDVYCKYYTYDSLEYEVPTLYHEQDCWVYGTGGIPANVNNSVQNYWFYLLANGGSQNDVTVIGIGLYDASRIAYRNMVYYFTLADSLNNMRQYSITNATALFGECSNQLFQVINAWAAVGVGTGENSCISTSIGGPTYLYSGVMCNYKMPSHFRINHVE